MKIKVIGSGSIWSISNSACYLVDDIFLVDMPNGCMKNMLKLNINPKSVNNILFYPFSWRPLFRCSILFIRKVKE